MLQYLPTSGNVPPSLPTTKVKTMQQTTSSSTHIFPTRRRRRRRAPAHSFYLDVVFQFKNNFDRHVCQLVSLSLSANLISNDWGPGFALQLSWKPSALVNRRGGIFSRRMNAFINEKLVCGKETKEKRPNA